jgi:hypothetical protein
VVPTIIRFITHVPSPLPARIGDRVTTDKGLVGNFLSSADSATSIRAEDLANKAHSLFGKGIVDESVQLFKEAISLNPDSGRARLRYALLLERSGKAKESADMYAKALAATNPKLAGREKMVAENNLGLMVTNARAHKKFPFKKSLSKMRQSLHQCAHAATLISPSTPPSCRNLVVIFRLLKQVSTTLTLWGPFHTLVDSHVLPPCFFSPFVAVQGSSEEARLGRKGVSKVD